MAVAPRDNDRPRVSGRWGIEIVAWAVALAAVVAVPLWLWSYQGFTGVSANPGRIIHIIARNDGDEAPGMWLVQKGREWNYRSTDRPQEIRVKRGEWVTLRLTSIDVTHIFAIPDLGVQEVVEAGKVTQIPFRAEREGIFPFECRAWCRPGHNEMTGQLIVLPP